MLSYASENLFKSDFISSNDFKIRAVAVMSAPTILFDNKTNNLRDMCDVFSMCEAKEEMIKTRPITYVSKSCPPTLLCAGASDYLVFSSSSEKLHEKLQENNVDSELNLSIGAGHCFEKVHASVEPSISIDEIQDAITNFILWRIK